MKLLFRRLAVRHLFRVVAAGVSPAVEPRRLARRKARELAHGAGEILARDRAAGCPPSMSGGTPDATLIVMNGEEETNRRIGGTIAVRNADGGVWNGQEGTSRRLGEISTTSRAPKDIFTTPHQPFAQ